MAWHHRYQGIWRYDIKVGWGEWCDMRFCICWVSWAEKICHEPGGEWHIFSAHDTKHIQNRISHHESPSYFYTVLFKLNIHFKRTHHYLPSFYNVANSTGVWISSTESSCPWALVMFSMYFFVWRKHDKWHVFFPWHHVDIMLACCTKWQYLFASWRVSVMMQKHQ